MSDSNKPRVAVVMGSRSDWPTMEHSGAVLDKLGIAYEARALSAHRTPDALAAYITDASERGVRVFIAAAGGAAHLAGVIAAQTQLPVLGVPIESKSLKGMDSLLSMVQMPAGIPVPTLAIGKPGAINAALAAAAILAVADSAVAAALRGYRSEQTAKVLREPDPRKEI